MSETQIAPEVSRHVHTGGKQPGQCLLYIVIHLNGGCLFSEGQNPNI